MFTFTNKTVLITGASAGIGKECALAFAEMGARLILTARRKERLEELAGYLHTTFQTESRVIELDVRDRLTVTHTFTNLPDEWKTVDILINNAGLARGFDTIQDGNLDDWEEMIDTNVKGLLYVTRAILPAMVSRKQGMIINMGSVAGREVYPKGNIYCASKHAVKALSQAIYRDTNGSNIRVCNIDAGMVETEFSEVRYHGDKERAQSVYKGIQPLTARDLAELVVFCASRPPHVTLHDIQIMATAQASTWLFYRE